MRLLLEEELVDPIDQVVIDLEKNDETGEVSITARMLEDDPDFSSYLATITPNGTLLVHPFVSPRFGFLLDEKERIKVELDE